MTISFRLDRENECYYANTKNELLFENLVRKGEFVKTYYDKELTKLYGYVNLKSVVFYLSVEEDNR